MPRKHRTCIPEVTYHTWSRCIEKKSLMNPKKMKDLMTSVLNLARKKYDYKFVGYTLMDNHFHFYIKTTRGGENISRIMQFIKSQFARRYNRMMNRTGPFWNERFGDTIIERTKDPVTIFFYILFYIAFNPVRTNTVEDPRDYRYSSFNCYLDENYIAPVKITLHEFFLNLGSTFKERVNKFLKYEEMYRKRVFPDCLFT
jgi:putative transposase